jgi:hypothetical protein
MRYGLLLGMAMVFLLSLPAMGSNVADSPDSVIIGSAAILPGQTQVSVPVYFVTHGDVTYFNLPLQILAAGEIRFQGHSAGVALEAWDDSWQGISSNGDRALNMGFADLGGDDNPAINSGGRRIEAFRLTFSVDEALETRVTPISARVDERAGGPLFGYADGMTSVAPVVLDGNLTFGAGEPTQLSQLPTEVSLKQNYPNPFNPSTEIEFALPEAEFVKLSIFNLLGQEVQNLLSEVRQAGYHKVIWNGTNSSGATVPSGAYFYRMDAGNYSQSMKMVLLK